MNLLKIKIFIAEHRIVLYVLFIIGIIITIINFPISSTIFPKDSTMVGVVGTLLGAIIGGVFTLIGSIYVNNKQIIANSEIKRKNVIYRPLYDELLEIKEIIDKENSFPNRVEFGRGMQTIKRHPQISAWQRINKDSRKLDTPKILKKQYEKYFEIVKRYVDIRPDANNIIQDIINEVLKKKIGTECTISNLGYFVSSDILKNGRNSNIIREHCKDSLKDKIEISDDIWDEIEKEIYDILENNIKIKNIKNSFYNWTKVQDETIELLELLILEINIKYEKQRR